MTTLIFTLSPEAVAQRCFGKKVFLKISQNSQKNTCARVFFNKVTGLSPATLFKKRLWHRWFSCEFLGTPFYIEHLWWLLLYPLTRKTDD